MQTRKNIELPIPELVNIADKPILLGGEVKTILVSEFSRQANFKWTETLIPNSKTTLHAEPFINLEEKTAIKIYHDIISNHQRMAICYMNETVGYGVFATNEIPTCSYVAFYSGNLVNEIEAIEKFDKSDCIYSMQAQVIYRHDDKLQSENYIINAKYSGNISRFFQHLPSKNIYDIENEITFFENYKFDDDINKNEIASSNLQVMSYQYNGLPLIAFKTSRKIDKGEILGYDYGKQYWYTYNMPPSLFYSNGSIVNTCHYTMNKVLITLHIDNLRFQFTIQKDSISKVSDDYHEEIDPGFSICVKEVLDEPIKNSKNELCIHIECSSHLKFFKPKSEVVCEKLNAMTSSLNVSTWRFDNESDTALIQLDENDESIINEIVLHLNKFNIKSEICEQINKKILSIKNLTPLQLIKLKNIEIISGQDKTMSIF